MKTLFSADPFSQAPSARMGQSSADGCVLLGTLTHPSDGESLFDRTIQKYQDLGWEIVRKETGRVFFRDTADETPETNIWACPPPPQMAGARRAGMHGPIEGRQVPVRMGQVPGHPDLHWGVYNGQYVRWPDCDPRYDANCPYPTSVIVENPGLGQKGVAQGFGGPGGGGFGGFTGGPGGMTGPVAGSPSPGSGPITGPSIPCGPAGGPSCPPVPGQITVMQKVYSIHNLMGMSGPSDVARGRDAWYHPTAPCPPGYYRSSPGSPCVKEGDVEDWGVPYFQQRPMGY